MSRRQVEFAIGEYYHIYNRGSNRQHIFREHENYSFLLRLLKMYALKLDVAVIAYCLMPNHYHLLVRQEGATAARLLPQYVFNSYAKAFNRRYGRSGTLFEGPFKAIHIDRQEHLIHLCRYMHGNPVKDGMVATPEQWPYSNYLEWIGERAGTLFEPEFVKQNFVTGAEYRRFVYAYLEDADVLPEDVKAYLIE